MSSVPRQRTTKNGRLCHASYTGLQLGYDDDDDDDDDDDEDDDDDDDDEMLIACSLLSKPTNVRWQGCETLADVAAASATDVHCFSEKKRGVELFAIISSTVNRF